jgi:hypothetical protein
MAGKAIHECTGEEKGVTGYDEVVRLTQKRARLKESLVRLNGRSSAEYYFCCTSQNFSHLISDAPLKIEKSRRLLLSLAPIFS